MNKLIASISLLIAAATSFPTPIDLVPRACTTIAPTVIDVLSLSSPNTPSPGQQFTLERQISPPQNMKTSLVTFNIPRGSTGCTLELAIPQLTENNQIASGPGDTVQADVWSTAPRLSPPTWNNQPAKSQMVATTRFPTGLTSKSQLTRLASNTCSETMSFLVELSNWQTGEMGVDFTNSVGGQKDLGFKMEYNC
ncbi:hypothetical protein EYZ11_007224 [Aspergillus tanneri]|uniref:Ubiquitin 3 binding protein But2 C-terminal domain-containing protein n=1 Tax=Aspergillus tanneri TaxID=1220188 RepID=A0A4S3JDI3_9EURO|nr:uncharacterized protein ATNIH1004_011387 [Aspergillus tanneri]KAA8642443.1 hypothetical protein ATNIH1004_011387 [Aspergillus tanneri]THC93299.1 hypothetical protein EYZ11_007224 [Aspergillus tanneri]